MDPRLAIPVEHQRLVLAINDQLQHLTHFDLLGLAPTTDKKEIRRAYHQISRKFHPDAYYGKEVGNYRALLDQLFKRARNSYELLTDDPRREAYVERLLAERERETAHLRKRRETETAAKEAAAHAEHERRLLLEQREKKREEERQAAERKAREERDRERRLRQGRRLSPVEGRQNKARVHHDRAMKELEAKRPGAAASLFRLAMDLDPGNAEYHEQWQRTLAQARVERADKAFETAKQYEEMGRMAEAAHYYLDAAESNPTPRFLAHAALVVRQEDPARARELALRALDGLSAAAKMGNPLPARDQGSVHAMCGYAFLAAGQLNTAREQADAARIALGDTENIRALLAAIKSAKA